MGRLQSDAARYARLQYIIVHGLQLRNVRSRLRHDDGHAGLRWWELQLHVQHGTLRLQCNHTTQPRRLRVPDTGLLLKRDVPDDALEWRGAKLLRLHRQRHVRSNAGSRSVRRIHRKRLPVHAIHVRALPEPWWPLGFLGVRFRLVDLPLLAVRRSVQGPRAKRLHGDVRRRRRPWVELSGAATNSS